jgi:hypothetical protein
MFCNFGRKADTNDESEIDSKGGCGEKRHF